MLTDHVPHLQGSGTPLGMMTAWQSVQRSLAQGAYLPYVCQEPVQGAAEARGSYRIQPLHLHIVLIVKVHTDGNSLNPGVICVAGVIEVPLVYLRTGKCCCISRAITATLRAPRAPCARTSVPCFSRFWN